MIYKKIDKYFIHTKLFYRLVLDETSRRPICTCPFFSAEYSDGKCYQEFTQGPCPFGQLMILDRSNGKGKCGCDRTNVSSYCEKDIQNIFQNLPYNQSQNNYPFLNKFLNQNES